MPPASIALMTAGWVATSSTRTGGRSACHLAAQGEPDVLPCRPVRGVQQDRQDLGIQGPHRRSLIISRLSSSAGGSHLSVGRLAGPGLIVACSFLVIAGADRRRGRPLQSRLQPIKSPVLPPSFALAVRVPLNEERNEHQQR